MFTVQLSESDRFTETERPCNGNYQRPVYLGPFPTIKYNHCLNRTSLLPDHFHFLQERA